MTDSATLFDQGQMPAAAAPRGRVAMSNLGQNGRLANQLLQYAFLRFYGWRNDAEILLPAWPAGAWLAEPPPAAAAIPPLPVLRYGPFEDRAALELWRPGPAPVDLDFDGYFQEIPASWPQHRERFRELLRFAAPAEAALARWRQDLAPPGTTLVAIHVRRGDYSTIDHAAQPQFRTVPVDWYLAWLEQIWPTLPAPRLYLATDDAAAIAPHFARYKPVPPPPVGLPDPLPDLMALRSGDCLAAANSSFSRLAGLLAADTQRQWIVDFAAGKFVPFAAWDDRAFWERFGPVVEAAPGDLARRLASAQAEHDLRRWRRLARKLPVLGPLALRAARALRDR
jgi:hypothetical protein